MQSAGCLQILLIGDCLVYGTLSIQLTSIATMQRLQSCMAQVVQFCLKKVNEQARGATTTSWL